MRRREERRKGKERGAEESRGELGHNHLIEVNHRTALAQHAFPLWLQGQAS
jgi:hypothetical protein